MQESTGEIQYGLILQQLQWFTSKSFLGHICFFLSCGLIALHTIVILSQYFQHQCLSANEFWNLNQYRSVLTLALTIFTNVLNLFSYYAVEADCCCPDGESPWASHELKRDPDAPTTLELMAIVLFPCYWLCFFWLSTSPLTLSGKSTWICSTWCHTSFATYKNDYETLPKKL